MPGLREFLKRRGPEWLSARLRRRVDEARRGGKEVSVARWLAACETAQYVETEEEPLIALWSELTGRTLSDREHATFLAAPELASLRQFLDRRGSAWLAAAGRRCVVDTTRAGKYLRLDRWLAACEVPEPGPVALSGRQDTAGSTQRPRKRVKGLPAVQKYGEDT